MYKTCCYVFTFSDCSMVTHLLGISKLPDLSDHLKRQNGNSIIEQIPIAN